MLYDIIIIGGGPAGYTAAERSAKAGLKALIFEQGSFGGACLNEGCIPTKTFLYSAKILSSARKSGQSYGVKCKDVEYDHSIVIARKNKIVSMLSSAVRNKLKKNGVEIVATTARVLEKVSESFVVEADGQIFNSRKLVIATGSSSAVPNIKGIEEGLKNKTVITSKEALDIEQIPKSLVIVGAGAIGLEMADFFQTVGCAVTVLDFLPQIASNFDTDISEILKKRLEDKGIKFILQTKICGFNDNEILCSNEQGEFSVKAELYLMATGRKPNVEHIGLENIHVNVEKGAIITDECCMTNVFGVYAIGDVNGKSMLAHTAYREAEVSVNHINGIKDKMNYNLVPYVIYTNPEVSGIGLTQSQTEGIDAKVTKMPMAMSGKYVTENSNYDGICKMITKNDDEVLGMQVVANTSSEFISYMSLIIQSHLGLKDVQKFVFAHPTVGEIIREAAWIDA